MANTHTTLSSLFIDIANAIRSKTNSVEPIIANNFPTEIANLRTGFNYNNHNITSISDYEFKNCDDLKSVDCPNLISIGAGAFENCTNLNEIILYENVESIGENAFKGCNCTIYCMFEDQPDGWHENWNPNNCEVISCLVEAWDISATEEDNVEAKLYSDIKNEGRYSLVVNGNGNVKDYEYNAPWDGYCGNIISITISDGVTSIGNYAFYNCSSLTSITIPNSVTSIRNGAFQYCKSLTSITIPDSVTSINSYAFYGCSKLKTAGTIGGNYNIEFGWMGRIPGNAFYSCSSLTSITIPNSVTNIGGYAFYACSSLTSIIYTGTISQWNVITKNYNWNAGTGNYTIHCTDGTISKDGTITYYPEGGAQ